MLCEGVWCGHVVVSCSCAVAVGGNLKERKYLVRAKGYTPSMTPSSQNMTL